MYQQRAVRVFSMDRQQRTLNLRSPPPEVGPTLGLLHGCRYTLTAGCHPYVAAAITVAAVKQPTARTVRVNEVSH
jgi:hypothetical protein